MHPDFKRELTIHLDPRPRLSDRPRVRLNVEYARLRPDDTILVREKEPAAQPRAHASSWLRGTVALAVLVGVFFRSYHLDRKVFWEDEILGTLHMLGYTEAEVVEASPRLVNAAEVQRFLRRPSPGAQRPIAATIRSLATEDPQHPPLYYVAGRLWVQLFGSSAAAIRSLSAVFGVLVLPCLYWFCLTLFGSSETALVAVALVAVSPFYVLYAQEAREYSLWAAAILLDALLFLRASSSNAVGRWLGYAAFTALSLYVYPLTGLVVLGFGAYLIIRERLRFTKVLLAYAAASISALAAFAPWLIAMVSSHGLTRGMSGIMRERLTPLAIGLIFARDLRFPFVDLGAFRIGLLSSTAVNLALTILILGLVAYALAVLVRRQPFAVWGFVVIALCLPMTSLLLVDLFIRGHLVYQARYFIPLLLGLQISVAALFAVRIFGAGADGIARRGWLTLFALVMAGEISSCVISSQADTWWNKADERSRSVAQVVNHSAKPLVVSDYFAPSILALSFYLDGSVPLRLDLKCSQCTPSPPAHTNLAADTAGYDTVFMLQLGEVPNRGRYRWIDPRPYPSRSGPLSMFRSI